ncbi:histidine utilization repressor [Pseudoduganella umbonata]|uniref:Histidine utilization repressor n=1 Tax=Pseudoduganella umbonata TaxID=864828 RepID=A0ABX5UM96_9BURK|nr:histidine utilization repressor [Pseudoduganella umbonata]
MGQRRSGNLEARHDAADTPIFQRIKDFLMAQIAAGHWKEGDVIPSEQALVKQFGVSRMTVNRAVRELTAESILTRRQGSGTYVAPQKVQATLLEIRSIADEIRARGHTHRSTLQRLDQGPAHELLAKGFELAAGHILFHSIIVHYENGVPIQVEDRWVNPQVAPDYLLQDFTRVTPSEYLLATAPLQAATYSLEALAAPRDIADMLSMEARQPCLVLRRRTRSGGKVASLVTMWHPGHRYQFAGSVATGAHA